MNENKQNDRMTVEKNKERFCDVKEPFVIKNLKEFSNGEWPHLFWNDNDWSEFFKDCFFKFRVHEYANYFQTIQWENHVFENQRLIDATIGQLLEWKCNQKSENPFSEFDSSKFCAYSAYNRLYEFNHVNGKEQMEQFIKLLDWKKLHLGEDDLLDNGKESTLWIGAGESYTPCHMDTNGYNFVVQLLGRKRWILFPPSDTPNLYPTRLPYESTTIWSKINFKSIDLELFPNFNKTSPKIIELEPGNILFVPRHWWHFVENCKSQNSESSLTISVNHWIFDVKNSNNEYLKDSIHECLAHFLMKMAENTFTIFDKELFNNIYKIDSHDIVLNALNAIFDQISKNKESSNQNLSGSEMQCQLSNTNKEDCEIILKRARIEKYNNEVSGKVSKQLKTDLKVEKKCSISENREYLKQFFIKKIKQKKEATRKIKINDVLDAFMEPEVLDLVMKKLIEKKNLSEV